jgi:galactokinase
MGGYPFQTTISLTKQLFLSSSSILNFKLVNSVYESAVSKFNELFGEIEVIIQSPGRINLLGEHVDYNDGFVMPAGINFSTYFCLSDSNHSVSKIHSLKYNESIEIDLLNPQKLEKPLWANFLLGVLRQLVDRGYTTKPFNCVFDGDIPTGAGLSSSASVECGFAYSLNELNNWKIPKKDLIEMAQWSEHFYVGVKCGIMDQFASMMSAKNSVMVLDCRSMEYNYLPLNLIDHTLVLCDTKVKHSLVDSEYNTRREECEQGIEILKKNNPTIKSLRDVTEPMLVDSKASMTNKVFARCLYVVQEISRVQQASEYLTKNNLVAFGRKMFETHEGLSKLYQVSCPELDFLVAEARANPSVLGSRMMGGGFGGCTINLVEKNNVEKFVNGLKVKYSTKFGIEMMPYYVTIEDGVNSTFKRSKNS